MSVSGADLLTLQVRQTADTKSACRGQGVPGQPWGCSRDPAVCPCSPTQRSSSGAQSGRCLPAASGASPLLRPFPPLPASACPQGNIKRDPTGYGDEFQLQWRHYKACLQLFLLRPAQEGGEFGDLVGFIAQVCSCYPNFTAGFAAEVMDLLDKHHAVLDGPLRQVRPRVAGGVWRVEVVPWLQKHRWRQVETPPASTVTPAAWAKAARMLTHRLPFPPLPLPSLRILCRRWSRR